MRITLRPTVTTVRQAPVVVALAIVVLAIAAAGCSKAGEVAAGAMIDLAEGSWTCRSQGDGDVVDLEVTGDGRFVATAVEADDTTDRMGDDPGEGDTTDGETAEGGWRIVDQDIEISIEGTVARVIDGEGLGIDAGTLTLEVPSMDRGAKRGETEELTFSVVVEGREEVAITPTGNAARRYPSGAINCDRD